MKQKTWTDLLGPYTRDCWVTGCYIVKSTGPNTYKVLWQFENGVYAGQAYDQWMKGY
jgi:hypothetical protein